MKIVNRKEFLLLPEATLYATHYESDGFGCLCMKYKTYFDDDNNPITWNYMELGNFDDYNNSEERYKKIDAMKEIGSEFPLRLNAVSRDGLYDQDQLFAVYDIEDTKRIIEVLYYGN